MCDIFDSIFVNDKLARSQLLVEGPMLKHHKPQVFDFNWTARTPRQPHHPGTPGNRDKLRCDGK